MIHRKPAGSKEDGVTDLDRVVGLYVDRLNVGEIVDRDQVEAEHPELYPELFERLEVFLDVGTQPDDNTALGTLGDYTLRRQIGRGAMGVVYEAWQGSMERVVALKVLPPGIAADNKAFLRFMREAKTAGQLSHQNVVAVYSTGVEEGTPWYAMEYVEGETLAQILERLKIVEPGADTAFGAKEEVGYFAKIATAFTDVADGLQHAHSKGIIHRDIKPSNLILDHEGPLRILDFGLAHLEGEESLTRSGDIVGTLAYMSPEQARAKRVPVDHRTDIYSLGATLYETLTGRPPFKGKDYRQTLSQITEREPTEPRKLNGRVPVDLETVVLKCLRKAPGDRYRTAEALGQDLRRFVRGDPIEARAQTVLEKLMRGVIRHRALIAGAAVLVVLLLVGLLVNNVLVARARDEARRDLYVSDMRLATMDWEAGHYARFLRRLERHVPRGEPDLRGWEWYYLRSLRGQELLNIPAGDTGLRAVAWSPDDQFIAAGDARGEVKVWRADTGADLVTLPGESTVNSVAWKPDSRHLAAAYEDGSVRVWDVLARQEISPASVRHEKGRASAVAWTSDGVWLASGGDETVKVWAGGTAIVNSLPVNLSEDHGPRNAICVSWSPDGRHLVAGVRFPPAIVVWDTASWEEVIRFPAHGVQQLACLAWSPGGDRLASAGYDEKIRFWNTETWKEDPDLGFDPEGPVYSLAWSPEAQDPRLLIGGDGVVKIWGLEPGAESVTRRGHSGRVWSVAWSTDGSKLASAGEDGTVKIWQPEGEQRSRELPGEAPVAFSPDGLWLAMEGSDEAGVVCVMDSSTGRLEQMLRCEEALIDIPQSVSFDPDSRLLAVTTLVGTVHIWDWETAAEIRLIHVGSSLGCVSWKPDGRQLAVGTFGGKGGMILDVETGQQVKRLDVGSGSAGGGKLTGYRESVALAWSPEGERLAATCTDELVRIFETDTWKKVRLLPPQRSFGSRDKFSNVLAWSPDGERLACGNSDGSVLVWDAGSGELLQDLRGHSGDVMSVAWHRDGMRLASGSEDRTVKIWDLKTYQELLSLKDDGRVSFLAWHPDGTRLLSAGGRPYSVRMWDARPGYEEEEDGD